MNVSDFVCWLVGLDFFLIKKEIAATFIELYCIT